MNINDEIKELVSTLNNVNYQIAELQRVKETLEPRLVELLGHGDEGSKTYVCGKHKVTATTGFIYSLNKDEWDIISANIPACFNPVRQRVAYDLDKSIIRDAEKYASQEELLLLSQAISKKPKKIHVKITAGV
jgi:hypothetical protein